MGFIEHFAKSKYKYEVVPLGHALVEGIEVKDFVLEAKLSQTGREYGRRICACLQFQGSFSFTTLTPPA